jgi:hypothetical protein
VLELVVLLPELLEWEMNGVVMHPLLTANLQVPQSLCRINTLYKIRSLRVAKALEENDWRRYVELHEPNFRTLALADIRHMVPKEQYHPYFGKLWNCSEAVCHHGEIFHLACMASATKAQLRSMMTEEECVAFNELGETVEIYRAFDINEYGNCWTTRQEIATQFANDFDLPFISKGTVEKSHVMSLFLRRNEFELITYSQHVRFVEKISVNGGSVV